MDWFRRFQVIGSKRFESSLMLSADQLGLSAKGVAEIAAFMQKY
jgi:hypothetical protein